MKRSKRGTSRARHVLVSSTVPARITGAGRLLLLDADPDHPTTLPRPCALCDARTRWFATAGAGRRVPVCEAHHDDASLRGLEAAAGGAFLTAYAAPRAPASA